MSIEEFAEKVRENIATYGRAVLGIFGGEGGKMPFCYTIGNSIRGFPELLLVGACGEAFKDVLNAASDVAEKRGRAFEDREKVDIGAKFPLLVIDANAPEATEEYAVQVRHFVPGRYRVQQVLAPDTKGRFPTDPHCAAPYRLVPILKARSH